MCKCWIATLSVQTNPTEIKIMKTNEKCVLLVHCTRHLEVQKKISSIKFKFLDNQKTVVQIAMIQAKAHIINNNHLPPPDTLFRSGKISNLCLPCFYFRSLLTYFIVFPVSHLFPTLPVSPVSHILPIPLSLKSHVFPASFASPASLVPLSALFSVPPIPAVFPISPAYDAFHVSPLTP